MAGRASFEVEKFSGHASGPVIVERPGVTLDSLATRGAEIAQAADSATRLNLLRGELLVQSGAIEQAKQAFQSAAQSTVEKRQRTRALIGMATCLTIQDRLDEALVLLDEAQPLAQTCGDQSLQTELHYRRGDILFALARVDE